ncbi:MAG: PilC/PilY family type IV pilus protein [Thermodesulfobacteriota bacterium]
MDFVSCSTSSAEKSTLNYSSGCNTIVTPIPSTDPPPFSSPSRYSDVWSSVANASASAYAMTPLVAALQEARMYLTDHKAADAGKDCRQKFVILITDGEDTLACNGTGLEDQSDQYKRRKGSAAAVKALYDAGYKIFVIGFGSKMPANLLNTLNWMAYYGGTDDASGINSGNTSAITVSSLVSTDSNYYCNADAANDPGNANLSGYAYVATDVDSLSTALGRALAFVNQSRISYTTASVAAYRTRAENFLYEASFKPLATDPFWFGHLIKYNLNSDGSVGSMVWDAGSVLQSRNLATSPRNVWTYVPFYSGMGSVGNLVPGQAKDYFGVATGTDAIPIAGYMTGDPAYNPDNWSLGDIFHSNPVTIGSPSPYFTDGLSSQAFEDFRNSYGSRNKIIVAGANDGQLHAFNTSDGSEQWSFVPPNLLPKLRFITHGKHPTTQTHKYFVDGPVTVADVWLGSGAGTSKSASDWHTLLVFGEGKGVRDQTGNATPPAKPWNSAVACSGTSSATYSASTYKYYCGAYAWSSSPYCDSTFNNTYTATYPYYCGYYAFDVTQTGASTPTFKWRLNSNSTQAPYLGEPWSKMAIGRVIIGGSEQWVGFIGAGYPSDTGNTGRGFFVVSLSDGSILWSFTKANNSSMTYGVPASPAVVDTDSDGFIDTAYVGDLGGNMWRFKFCTKADGSGCGTGNWSGGLLFQAASGGPIYTAATVAKDPSSLWVFWGTGDRENPTSTSGQDRAFAVKDNDRTATYTIGNLQDVSASGTIYNGTSSGWYINLGNGTTGEKSLGDPTVFGGIVLFTTYTPDTSDTNLCSRVGSSKLYAIAMMRLTISGITYAAGAGVLTSGSAGTTTGGAKSASLATLGGGMAKSPIVSQNPLPGMPTDIYLTLSGGGSQSTGIITTAQLGSSPLNDLLNTTGTSTQLLHWKDGRIQ